MAGVVALAGCGGGSGGGGSATTTASAPTATTATSPAPAPTVTATTPAATAPAPTTPTATTPQEAPGEGNGSAGGGGGGGTGGTEPARTELTFSGSSAGVTPRNAGVAPYISVKVSLVSRDGSAHKLTIDGKTLSVGGARKSAFVTLPGLRPGKSYTGTADGKTIRILSTSEPGP